MRWVHLLLGWVGLKIWTHVHLWLQRQQERRLCAVCAAYLQAWGPLPTSTACRNKATNRSGTKSGTSTWTPANRRKRSSCWKLSHRHVLSGLFTGDTRSPLTHFSLVCPKLLHTNSGIRCQAGQPTIFRFWLSRTLALNPERQSARKSKLTMVGWPAWPRIPSSLSPFWNSGKIGH